jgi:uncharacterized protein (DUF3820 family)
MSRPDDFVMPFGKYKGKKLDEIPLTYLDWLLGKVELYPETKRAIKEYLTDPVIARELEQELGE